MSIQSSFVNFQYQLLPSAFKIAECPTYFCWKSMTFSRALWKHDVTTNREMIKNRTIAVLAGAGGYLGGMIALPITLCSTPITLLADIVIGTAECIFCIYQGLKKEDLLIIAHRKFIISPCQHLAFCLGAITGLGLSLFFTFPLIPLFGLKTPLIFWTFGYAHGQVAVGKLPRSLNHHSLNIFIGGGSGEGENEQRKWLDDDFTDHRRRSKPTSKARAEDHSESHAYNRQRSRAEYSQTEWNDFIDKEVLLLGRIDDANLNIEYLNFKKRLLSKCTPINLLELSINFSQTDLQKKHRKLALILHPDKNLPREQEATVLFSVLQKAIELLSEQ